MTTNSKKSIQTLVSDIENLLKENNSEVKDEILNKFLTRVGITTKEKLSNENKEFTLRMSNIGKKCVRQLWLEKNHPDLMEKLDAPTLLKFQYGNLIEDYLIFLAELSGHTVEGFQTENEINGIKGHRDVVIDGVLVDVKSASTYSFQKFKNHLTDDSDAFGYIIQLQSYLHCAQDDPIVTEKNKAAFLVMDKQHGHICLDFHEKQNINFDALYEERKKIVNGDKIPDRAFPDEPEGKSGNRKLGINCSYCSMKKACWPNLRLFLYANKPLYLTHVALEPKVPEVKDFSKLDKKED